MLPPPLQHRTRQRLSQKFGDATLSLSEPCRTTQVPWKPIQGFHSRPHWTLPKRFFSSLGKVARSPHSPASTSSSVSKHCLENISPSTLCSDSCLCIWRWEQSSSTSLTGCLQECFSPSPELMLWTGPQKALLCLVNRRNGWTGGSVCR